MSADLVPEQVRPLLALLARVAGGRHAWQAWQDQERMTAVARSVRAVHRRALERGEHGDFREARAILQPNGSLKVLATRGTARTEASLLLRAQGREHVSIEAELSSRGRFRFETIAHAQEDEIGAMAAVGGLERIGNSRSAFALMRQTCEAVVLQCTALSRASDRAETVARSRRVEGLLSGALVVAIATRPDRAHDFERADVRREDDGRRILRIHISGRPLPVEIQLDEAAAADMPGASGSLAYASRAPNGIRRVVIGKPIEIVAAEIDADPAEQARLIRALPEGLAERIAAAAGGRP